ncbi:AbrB family transcriptional regulator [Roseobacter sp.]|uniref:AbrB family transcriptional regulator n=1 Tax=Roseobacter sp. TaxID=1907202 RepID=UPI003298BB97
MKAVTIAFVVAGIGVAVFLKLQLPLPWLLGPICACLLAALLRVPLAGVASVNDGMRTILGVAVGATLTPTVLASLPAMWPTLALVPVMIIAVGCVGVPYFQRLCGYDFPTAYYATMPGGLQDMILFGEEAGANPRTLSLIHATRVLVIVASLPFLMKGIWAADLTRAPGAPATSIPLIELGVMTVCAIVGWRLAKWAGMFGASILGPLIVAAVCAMTGLLHHRPPAEAIWAAQFFIGMGIGCKYAGVTLAEVRKDLVAGLGFCALLILLTVVFVEVIYNLGLASGMEALLAFAPGGQAELTVLALIVGADVAFVVAHHMLRIFMVILGAPVAAKLFNAPPPG